jgi:hypothetical protein
MRQMNWTDRTFCFEFPAGIFPGIVERLRGTPGRVAELISGAPLHSLTTCIHGEWSINQHIGHLDDLHELDVVRLAEYRAGKVILSAADMSNRRTHTGNYNTRSTQELLAHFRQRRLDLVAELETLSAGDISAIAMHPRLQRPLRLVDWTFFVAEHDDHHVARIRELLREFE